MKVTVTTEHKKAVFTWDDTFDNCHLTSVGFDDEEIDHLMANKVHEGADLEGYTVDCSW